MFAGHIGVALAIGRGERRVNVGVLIAAALLLDAVLWLLVLAGCESVSIPAHFATTHQPEFVFPYSHSLLAAVAWSALAGVAVALLYSRPNLLKSRVACLVALAVFSHWLLDALVHRPELPLAGRTSATVGLSLWSNMPLALGVETALVLLGLWLYLPGSGLGRGKSIAFAVVALLLMAFTAIGMTVAPAPPSAVAMAASSLVTLAVVCALFSWLGRQPSSRGSNL